MFGGDEVSSLVFDLGTFNHRIGYSGEDSPKCVYQPIIGVNSDKYYFNEYGLRYNKPGTKVYSCMNLDGTIKDIDMFGKILDNLLKESMTLDLTDHPVLFSEPSLHNKENRIKITEYMFEKYKIPAIYICKNAVLSGFSCGRSTCLVFDSGHNITYAVPVNEGYALQKCLIKNNIAGDYITQLLEKKLNSKNIVINPFYAFKREKDGDQFKTTFINNEELKLYDKSYETFWKREIVRDIKEACLITNDEPLKYDSEKDIFIPTSIPQELVYDLPDGNTINLVEDRNTILERMFNPIKDIEGFSGYHQMVNEAISKADLEIKKELYSNIFLCGGNTLFSGFAERFQKQISSSNKQLFKLKIITHPSNTERKFSTWIGGSILSSLGTFHQLWLSKAEFEEHGAMIIERKCA
jgi:actin-like protein 6A